MTLFVALNVETRMVSATSLPAQGPRTSPTAVAAMASLAVAAAGPRATREARTAIMYKPASSKEPARKARGELPCGSTTLPGLVGAEFHPPQGPRRGVLAK